MKKEKELEQKIKNLEEAVVRLSEEIMMIKMQPNGHWYPYNPVYPTPIIAYTTGGPVVQTSFGSVGSSGYPSPNYFND